MYHIMNATQTTTKKINQKSFAKLTTAHFIAGIGTIRIMIAPELLRNALSTPALKMLIFRARTVHFITSVPTIVHRITLTRHGNAPSVQTLEPRLRTHSMTAISGLFIGTIGTVRNSITRQLERNTAAI